MVEEKSQQIRRVLSVWDFLFFMMAFFAAIFMQPLIRPLDQIDVISHLAFMPFILALLILFLSYFDAYRSFRNASGYFYACAIFKTMVATLGLLFSVLFFLKIQYISRFVILTYASISGAGMIIVRLLLLRYFHRTVLSGKCQMKILIIGSGERAQFLSQSLKDKSEWGIEIVGYLDIDPELTGRDICGSRVLGTIGDINAVLKKQVIDQVIVAIPRTLLADVDSVAHACEEEGVKFLFMADVFNFSAARITLEHLGGVPLLTLEPVALNESKLMLKRLIDIGLTVLFMPLFLIAFTVIAIAIRLDDGGPIIFIQERVGYKKNLFRMFKFRTMHVNAEEMLKEIEHLNEAEGPNFKIANDPRITRIGLFLRHTSLDELPQLFNVLRGEMSLVGPRPMSIRDVSLFDKGIQRRRFSVKPGITCIWQISGRNNLSFNKWLELDLHYIDNWSLFLDMSILLKTIPVVLLGKGAM